MSNIENVHPALAIALEKKGYKTLTPVQDAALAPELQDQDLLVSAQTGSGKTVAFGLTMASTLLGESSALLRADAPLALCIAPTRELALQVKRELDWLYKDAGAKTASCVGGMDMRTERAALTRGAHIVVGTPGRLCDHIKRGSLDMSELQCIVLDEADEMLKMGFREELEIILGAAPDERRTLMFSATVPKTILGMTKKYQRNAVRVNTAAEAKQHLDIDYQVMTVSNADRENAIINVLRFYNAKNAIVFGDTRVAVNRMTQRFNNRGFSVVALSGELSQAERSNALQALRDGRAQVCVATDVAARGLDLPDLELVIHADVPRNREALLHRSGRTGRAGRKGVSALIVAPSRRRNAERLLRDAGITAEWGEAPSADAIIAKDNERLLDNMTLTEEVSDEERTMVARLLKAHSAEHIATAFIRQYREGQSAPEELMPANYKPSKEDRHPDARNSGPRENFDNGVWFSLNVGRKQKAEPKWILPMLMKSGGLKKGEIGAIKIIDNQTFVEMAPKGVERFLENIGPDMKIEAAITAARVDGKPNLAQPTENYRGRDRDGGSGRSKGKPYGDKRKSGGDKKPWGDKKRSYDDKPSGNKKPWGDKKKSYDDKPAGEKKPSYEDKPKRNQNFEEGTFKRKSRKATGSDMPSYDKPKSGPKDGAKKPHKKKLARAAALKEKGAPSSFGSKGGVKKGSRKSTRKPK
ncbi:helicase [Litorimonas cladophorae]|uniref:Helicase n=1 Tax=Litorimonas cladophorae TaxID=1220491 RepID=A0A918KCA4_9PROT|nr:DEAD/DEAH box helicase [Litorimonas cladophorae]GGX56316.1 helicase [Litorimonas cladophorae]